MKTTVVSLEDFVAKFCFNPDLVGYVSAERECFIVSHGIIVPRAAEVLALLNERHPDLVGHFSYELSACQIEFKSGPCRDTRELFHALAHLEEILDGILHELGLEKRWFEVAPADMSLDVYPDPMGRYAYLSSRMSENTLRAACRITGTHFHVGMPNMEVALRTYNRLITEVSRLTQMGDNSEGERLALYRTVAPNCDPVPYGSQEEFYAQAIAQGFAENPRDCWHAVRLTAYGTIEVRVFGVPKGLCELVMWADEVLGLCLTA